MTAASTDVARRRDGTIAVRDGVRVTGRRARPPGHQLLGAIPGPHGSCPLDADAGLYLPVNSIHMLFMRFPIDALFVDAPDAAGDCSVSWLSVRACPPGAGW